MRKLITLLFTVLIPFALYGANFMFNVGGDYYKFNPYLSGYDIFYSTYSGLFGGSTQYIQVRQTLQNGSSFYVELGSATQLKTSALYVYGDALASTITAHSVRGDASDGLLLESFNGTDVGILGPGNTANVTWYGTHNFPNVNSINLGSMNVGGSITDLNVFRSTAQIKIDALNTSTGTLYSLISTTSTNAVRVDGSTQTKTGGLNVMGNVGIGTLNPNSKLHIVPVDAYSSGWLRGVVSTGASVIENGNVAIGMHTDKSMYFMTKGLGDYTSANWSPSIAMKIQNEGNVGIGSLAPESNLHVSGTFPKIILQGSNEFLGPQMRFRDSAGTTSSPSIPTQPDFYAGALYWDAYDGSAWQGVGAFLVNGDGDPTATSLPTSFNFLTTSPNSVNASVKVQLNSTGDMYVNSISTSDSHRLGVGTFSPDTGVKFQVMPSTFVVMSTGAVGIGTISPSQKLTIVDSSVNGAQAYLQSFRSSSGSNSQISFSKARGSQSAPSSVSFGDSLGQYAFNGYDGTSYVPAASIIASVDGVTGTNDMPGRIGFRTTPDGGSSTLERMAIDNAGNVGVGTASPLARLHVNQSAGAGKAIIGSTDGGANDDELQFTSAYSGLLNSSDITGSIVGAPSNTGGRLIFKTSQNGTGTLTERMRIDDSGFVGIGTSAPTKKLHVVNGSADHMAILESTSTSGYGLIISAANDPLRVGGNGEVLGQKFIVTGGGNVGIGTTAPSAKLTVRIGTDRNFLTDTGAGAISGAGGIYLRSINDAGNAFQPMILDADPLIFNIGGANSEKMRITSAGNVGIGTTSPSSKLDIRGTGSQYSNQAKDLTFGNQTYTESIIRSTETTTSFGGSYRADLAFLTNNNNSVAEKVRIQYDGNVGIGTTNPILKLQVFPNAAAPSSPTPGTASGAMVVQGDGTTYGLHIGVVNTGVSWLQSMRSDGGSSVYPIVLNPAGGNVGIGTTSPTTKFHARDTSNDLVATIEGGGTGGAYIDFLKTDATDRTWYLGATGSVSDAPDNSFALVDATAGNLFRMVVDSSGNIGIGTTNPSAKMHIYGSAPNTRYQLSTSTSYLNAGLDIYGAYTLYDDQGIGQYQVHGGTVWYANSDKRIKKKIKAMTYGLDEVNNITPVFYNYKSDSDDAQRRLGFIAQTVEHLIPEAVNRHPDPNYKDGLLGLSMTELVPVLWRAVQDLSKRNDLLEDRIKKLEEVQYHEK